jgi:hypothetical protein
MSTTDPHNNEYLAAMAGLHEQTPSRRPHYAVGDWVSGFTAGRHWSGRVQWFDGDRSTPHIVVHEGSSLGTYPVADITH